MKGKLKYEWKIEDMNGGPEALKGYEYDNDEPIKINLGGASIVIDSFATITPEQLREVAELIVKAVNAYRVGQ